MIILQPTSEEKTINIIPRVISTSGTISLKIRKDGDGAEEVITPLSIEEFDTYISITFPSINNFLKEDCTYSLEITRNGALWYRDKIYVTSQTTTDMALNSHQIGNGSIYETYNILDDDTYIVDSDTTLAGSGSSTIIDPVDTTSTTTGNAPVLIWNNSIPFDIPIGSLFSFQIRAWYNPTSITVSDLPEGLSVNSSGVISGIATGENRETTMTINLSNSFGETSNEVSLNLSDEVPLVNPLRVESGYSGVPSDENSFNSSDNISFDPSTGLIYPSDGTPLIPVREGRINYIRIGIPYIFIFNTSVSYPDGAPVTSREISNTISGLNFFHNISRLYGVVSGSPRTETIDFTARNEFGASTKTFQFQLIENEGTEILHAPYNLTDDYSTTTYLKLRWDTREYTANGGFEFVNVYLNGELTYQKTYLTTDTIQLFDVQGVNEVQVSYVDYAGNESPLSEEGVFLKMIGQGAKPEITTDSDRVYYAQRGSFFQLEINTDIDASNRYDNTRNSPVPSIELRTPISGTSHFLEGTLQISSEVPAGTQWTRTFRFLNAEGSGEYKTFNLEATDSDPSILNAPSSISYSINSNGDTEVSWIEGAYNGTISETELYQDDVLIRRVFNNELNYSIQGLSAGTYLFKARHKDSEGDFSPYSDTLTVNI